MSSELDKRVRDTLDRLRTERDDLQVRMHLAAAEVRDEWDELEKKWEHVDARLKSVGKEARGASGDVLTALDLLGDEIGHAYQRIRDRLKG